MKPHVRVVPFGTRPVWVLSAAPPGRRAAIEEGTEDGIDATVEGILEEQIGEVMEFISVSTQAFASTPGGEDEAKEGWNEAAPTWPRPETRTAYATTVRVC